MNANLTDIEQIARYQIAERTHLSPRFPRPRRRHLLANRLRQVADRLDA